MGKHERPVKAVMSQHDQKEQVQQTDNGPTLQDEEARIAELFGEPNADGIYLGGGVSE